MRPCIARKESNIIGQPTVQIDTQCVVPRITIRDLRVHRTERRDRAWCPEGPRKLGIEHGFCNRTAGERLRKKIVWRIRTEEICYRRRYYPLAGGRINRYYSRDHVDKRLSGDTAGGGIYG